MKIFSSSTGGWLAPLQFIGCWIFVDTAQLGLYEREPEKLNWQNKRSWEAVLLRGTGESEHLELIPFIIDGLFWGDVSEALIVSISKKWVRRNTVWSLGTVPPPDILCTSWVLISGEALGRTGRQCSLPRCQSS